MRKLVLVFLGMLGSSALLAQTSRAMPAKWLLCEALNNDCDRVQPATTDVWLFNGPKGKQTILASLSSQIELTVERFEGGSVVIHRKDLSGLYPGWTATYTGTVQGGEMRGTAIFSGPRNETLHGKWVAIIPPKDLGCNPSAPEQDAVKAGIALFGLGEKTPAFECYLLAAQEGDHDAENEVAGLYHVGYGTPQDDAKAVYWWQKSGEFNSMAANNLSIAYKNGIGTETNPLKAQYWADTATLLHNEVDVLANAHPASILDGIGYAFGAYMIATSDDMSTLRAKVKREGTVIDLMDKGVSREEAEGIAKAQEHAEKWRQYELCAESHRSDPNVRFDCKKPTDTLSDILVY
jgi:Sel1 repeat